MSSRVAMGAALVFAALALTFVVTHPPEARPVATKPGVAPLLARVKGAHPVRSPARVRPSKSARPRTKAARTPAATRAATEEQDSLLDQAMDEQAAATLRALALDALEAEELEEEQVVRLEILVAYPGVDEGVREAALGALLAVALDGTSPAARTAALATLIEFGDVSVESRLTSLLSDEDPELRGRVAAALGDVDADGEDTAVRALEHAFASETNETVQDAIVGSIVRVNRRRAGPVLERLAQGASGRAAAVLARHREDLPRIEVDPPAPPQPPPPAPGAVPGGE